MDHIGFTPIYDPDSIRFAFNETPMRPGMAPVSVAEDALPFFITMNITGCRNRDPPHERSPPASHSPRSRVDERSSAPVSCDWYAYYRRCSAWA